MKTPAARVPRARARLDLVRGISARCSGPAIRRTTIPCEQESRAMETPGPGATRRDAALALAVASLADASCIVLLDAPCHASQGAGVAPEILPRARPLHPSLLRAAYVGFSAACWGETARGPRTRALCERSFQAVSACSPHLLANQPFVRSLGHFSAPSSQGPPSCCLSWWMPRWEVPLGPRPDPASGLSPRVPGAVLGLLCPKYSVTWGKTQGVGGMAVGSGGRVSR